MKIQVSGWGLRVCFSKKLPGEGGPRLWSKDQGSKGPRTTP